VSEPVFELGPYGPSEAAENDLHWVRELVHEACELVIAQERSFPGQTCPSSDSGLMTIAEYRGIFRIYEEIPRADLDERR